MPVSPGVIGSTDHRPKVVVGLWRSQGCAGQLLVRDVYFVLMNSPAQHLQVVGADLVAGTSGAAVDHDCDLAFEQPELLGYRFIIDLIHPLDFQKVVSAAQGSKLRSPSLASLHADLG